MAGSSQQPHYLCLLCPLCTQLKDKFVFQGLPLKVVTTAVARLGAARDSAVWSVATLANLIATFAPLSSKDHFVLLCSSPIDAPLQDYDTTLL